jgi:glycosyltransferase involved in cell wall biosynthesis
LATGLVIFLKNLSDNNLFCKSCVHLGHNLRIFCYNSGKKNGRKKSAKSLFFFHIPYFMHIGIDARMSGPNVGGGGLGRYVEQLLKELPGVDKKNRYVLFEKRTEGLRTKDSKFIPQSSVLSSQHWYTISEQISLPPLIDKQHLDLVHFPHWNVPLFLKTPFVVTIHDLILLEEPKSARATTRHPVVYALKYAGFKRVLSHAIRASKKIITVSYTTKNDILKHFPDVPEKKIVVIYEGVTQLPNCNHCPTVPLQSLLYVGNCYPHKNLDTLLDAFDLLHKTAPEVHLIFAGRSDPFSKRLEQNAHHHSSAPFIHFEKNPNDERLCELYERATLYVFPSRSEGFGLPPLEAMSMGVPVATSDIASLREILNEAAVYFPPNDPMAIAHTIEQLLKNSVQRTQLIAIGREQIKKYSWKKMAEEIVRVYQSCGKT